MTWRGSPIAHGWEYEHDSGARIVLDHLHRTSNGFYAWVELRIGEGRPIVFGRKDIMAPRAAGTFAKDAAEKDDTVPWSDGISQAFYEVIQADREGATTIDLARWEPGPTQWILKPLIEQGGHTRLIAPGDSGKSFFALACGLAVATGDARAIGAKPAVTGPVLYLDWETDVNTHARRLRALARGLDSPMPDKDLLIYQEHTAPLYRVAHQIHRTIDTYGVVLAIVDSVMLARGAGGDKAEDSAIRLFEALREFTVPAMLIDHKSKEAMAKGRRGGYGSVVNENTVRLQWEMTKILPIGSDRKAFVLASEKHNNTGRLPPLGYQFQARTNSELVARFTRVEADEITGAVESSDLASRIAYLLSGSNEPLSVKQVAADLGDKEPSVRATLNAREDMFENRGTKAKGLWMVKDEFRDEGEQVELAAYEPPVEPPPAEGWDGEVF